MDVTEEPCGALPDGRTGGIAHRPDMSLGPLCERVEHPLGATTPPDENDERQQPFERDNRGLPSDELPELLPESPVVEPTASNGKVVAEHEPNLGSFGPSLAATCRAEARDGIAFGLTDPCEEHQAIVIEFANLVVQQPRPILTESYRFLSQLLTSAAE